MAASLRDARSPSSKSIREASPPKAPELTTKLVEGEKVDILTGPVHSGVAMAMTKIAREVGVPTIDTNAGANAITRQLCAKNVFRSSFSNGQVGLATGKAMADAGIKKAVTFTWKYAAGEEMVGGFNDTFTKGGGKVLKDITVPFPNVEFQAALAEIASIKPDAVYSFFAGGGAAKFIKDYAAANLQASIPLWGPGFLTDGVEKAVGSAGNGVKTVLHYVDDLDNPENKAFRAAFNEAYKIYPDVYAVQGWDAMQLIDAWAEGGRRRCRKARRILRGDGQGVVQEPARAVPAVLVAQSDPEFLSARAEGRQQPPRKDGGDRVCGSDDRLQAFGLSAAGGGVLPPPSLQLEGRPRHPWNSSSSRSSTACNTGC